MQELTLKPVPSTFPRRQPLPAAVRPAEPSRRQLRQAALTLLEGHQVPPRYLPWLAWLALQQLADVEPAA
jgi:hypothetical protein